MLTVGFLNKKKNIKADSLRIKADVREPLVSLLTRE
jgi:hypothetical protein